MAEFALVGLVFLVGGLLSIVALIDAARRPVDVWDAAGQTQSLWVVLSALGIVIWPAGLVLALVYLFVIRPQLVAATRA